MVEKKGSSSLITIFLPEEWDIYIRRPHWLAMAGSVQVLAIEPPLGILTLWRYPETLRRYLKNKKGVRKGEANILFYRPMSLFSYGAAYRLSWITFIDRILLSAQLRRLFKSLRKQFSNIVTVIFKIQQYYTIDVAPSDLMCYEVTDEYRFLYHQDGVDFSCAYSKRADEIERRILKRANLVFASSTILCENKKRLNPNTYYIPNCADYRHFSKAQDGDLKIPEDMEGVSYPRIGYVGNIDESVDMDLMNFIAEEKPEWSMVYIGNICKGGKFISTAPFKKSRAYKNVHYLGFRDYDLLPAYMKSLDVCVSPFSLSEWNKSRLPNKIYQYLSTGKPVVSSDLPSIRSIKAVLYIARDKEDFLHLIEKALGESDRLLREKRKAFARENSTHIRAREKLRIIKEKLEKA